jgi:hypothetical protein
MLAEQRISRNRIGYLSKQDLGTLRQGPQINPQHREEIA